MPRSSDLRLELTCSRSNCASERDGPDLRAGRRQGIKPLVQLVAFCALRFSVATLLSAFMVCLAGNVRADVHCPPIFGDHMVLQRERPVSVWGTANPGESVTVTFANHHATTTTGADGSWRVALPPLAASSAARTLTISGRTTLSFTDVLVGDVWLCSGQSNMEKPFGPRKGQKPTDRSEEEMAHADHPLLRLYQVPQHGRPDPKHARPTLRWLPSSPANLAASQFSAVAYLFGRDLHAELGVPVGVIHASFGGTQIEAWMPEDAFARDPALHDLRTVHYAAWVKGVQATELFRSMLSPLIPYTLRGWLWYQGEANCMQADGPIYTAKMRALIASWRGAWDEPDAPFYYALIAPFHYSQWESFPKGLTSEALPVFWEAQLRALDVPHTGIISTTDLAGSARDIHPTDKQDVGQRFARLALAETYGRTNFVAQSPRFDGFRPSAPGKFALHFSHTGTGLSSRDGAPLSDFEIAGDDRVFHPARAEAARERVIVSSPDVPQPVAVRFGWHETANPNLVNSAGLPALPFRTDDWPVITERPKLSKK